MWKIAGIMVTLVKSEELGEKVYNSILSSTDARWPDKPTYFTNKTV
jgi:Fe-S cluster biosynthesis and repair protein YggX